MKRTEKIEVDKGFARFYYTGSLEDLEDGWVRIHTIRGETLTFRKEQITQRIVVQRSELDGKNESNNNIRS